MAEAGVLPLAEGPAAAAASIPVGVPIAVAVPESLGPLSSRGFPLGLCRCLLDAAEHFAVRLWIVDNSGSMHCADGQRVVCDSEGRTDTMSATRWSELSHEVCDMAELSVALGARSDFQLINPHHEGQFLSVGSSRAADPQVELIGTECTLDEFHRVIRSVSPSGSTPLTESLERVEAQLLPVAAELRARGQQAVIVLATDGLPNDPSSFLAALHRVQQLPVWLVLRLCTDEQPVVDFWSEVEAALEAPLEVLDDLRHEAREVARHNAWLAYGLPLHHARLFGLRDKTFDLLDERPLMPSQLRQLCELLLGCPPLADPQTDFAAFVSQLRRALDVAHPVYDVLSAAYRPWIDADMVEWNYSPANLPRTLSVLRQSQSSMRPRTNSASTDSSSMLHKRRRSRSTLCVIA
ncbi:hypothetical protein AB1Y20_000028 [Prymnesium parvum]|uniref:VWFA domain-containing protein n=1 Tax=Prymnesium parvum TaxID=97485 RepID=A0AB34K873_PRYPA